MIALTRGVWVSQRQARMLGTGDVSDDTIFDGRNDNTGEALCSRASCPAFPQQLQYVLSHNNCSTYYPSFLSTAQGLQAGSVCWWLPLKHHNVLEAVCISKLLQRSPQVGPLGPGRQ